MLGGVVAVEEIPVTEGWVADHLGRHFVNIVNREADAWGLVADVHKDVGEQAFRIVVG